MKATLLKISGKAVQTFLTDDGWLDLCDTVMRDGPLVIVHGGGSEITSWSDQLGLQTSFVRGQRVTSARELEVVVAIQSGLINTRIVNRLLTGGREAIGLSGISRGLMQAEISDASLGYVGVPEIRAVPDWFGQLLNNRVIPVFSSVSRTRDGGLVNVNADLFAEVLATMIGAGAVYFASDVEGVRFNGNVLPVLGQDDAVSLVLTEDIHGGMIPKVQSCSRLLDNGIEKIWIGPSDPAAILSAVTGTGTSGTWICKEIDHVA